MLRIEPLRQDDLQTTAGLHKDNLRLGLFPKLGRDFLTHYQDSFSRSPYGIALVARAEGEIVGALFATTSNSEHYRWVTQNMGVELALAGVGAMVTHPHVALSFARTRLMRYSRGIARHMGLIPTPQVSGAVAPPVSVLSHIITSSGARRRGIGRKLVDAFKTRASARGVHRAVLVTEEGGLGTPFFERLGCRLVKKRAGQDGSMLREYRLILDEEGAYEELDGNRNHRIVVRPYPERLGAARPVIAGFSGPAERR